MCVYNLFKIFSINHIFPGHGHSHEGKGHGHSHDGKEGHGHSHDSEPKKEVNINVRAAFIHVIGDLVQSIGVLIAAIIIKFQVRILIFCMAA